MDLNQRTNMLPRERKFIQSNDGGGTISASYAIDLHENNGKVRVSKPTAVIFDSSTDIDEKDGASVSPDIGNKIDKSASSILRYSGRFCAFAFDPYLTKASADSLGSDVLDVDSWYQEDSTNAPDSGGDAVVWNGKIIAIDNTVSAGFLKAYNGSSWSTYLGTGGTISNAMPRIDFIQVSEDGNLYVVDELNYVHRIKPDNTAEFGDDGDQGTLDFSARPYEITCTGSNSTRLFIGYRNTYTNKGGIIEWDMSATSLTANKVHKLSSIPRCLPTKDDVQYAVMSDGTIKYFNNIQFVNYSGMRLPKISGRYAEDFIHPNGWDVKDDMLHLLIKGGVSNDDSFIADSTAELNFPSAIYCVDPDVGVYPRYSLTSNIGTQQQYGSAAVYSVGALRNLETDYAGFFASYTLYTGDSASDINSVLAYVDEENSFDNKAYILFDSVERSKSSNNIELVHRVMESGNSIRAFYQEYEADEQVVNGVWNDTTHLNTLETVDVDDKWLAFVKIGPGAGRFLRVDSTKTGTTSVITFKDENTEANKNDSVTILLIKFRYFGTANSSTKDYTTLTFPSGAKTRKVKVLYELTQVAGSVNELDYTLLDS